MYISVEPENAAIMDDGEKKKEEIDGGTDVDMEDGPSRAEGVLKFEVQNFGKLKDTVYSDPTMIRNLQWSVFSWRFYNFQLFVQLIVFVVYTVWPLLLFLDTSWAILGLCLRQYTRL